MDETTTAIVEFGFRCFDAYGYVSIVDPRVRRQVAVYRAPHNREWNGWGWVEFPAGDGREDFTVWAEFLLALQAVAESRGARA